MREVMLVFHFIGLAMGVGTSFAFMFLGRAASRLEKDRAGEFSRNTLALGTMGHIGITLLILSGGYLMTPFWGVLPSMPLLIAKLVLVVILTVFIILAGMASRRARKGDLSQLPRLAKMGPFMLLSGLAIIVLAVLVFR